MRVDVARQPLSLVLAVCVALLTLFAVRFALAPSALEIGAAQGTLLGTWVNRLAAGAPFFRCLVSGLIILFSGVYITRIISAKLVLPARNYLPSVFYIMITCGILFPCCDLAAVLASYLTIKASAYFIGSFKRTHNFGRIFAGSMMLGTAALLSAPAVALLALMPIAMGVFRRNGRETFVAAVGLLLPIFAYAYVIWFGGGEFTAVFTEIAAVFSAASGVVVEHTVVGIARMVALGIFGALLLLALVYFRAASSDMRTTAYKVFIYMMCFLVLALVSTALLGITTATLLLLAIPSSFLIPLFFTKNRSLPATVIYFVTLGTVLALNIMQIVL